MTRIVNRLLCCILIASGLLSLNAHGRDLPAAHAGELIILRGLPQESPHLSDRSKNVGEERLVLQHLGEAMHQRAQPVITHGGQ